MIQPVHRFMIVIFVAGALAMVLVFQEIRNYKLGYEILQQQERSERIEEEIRRLRVQVAQNLRFDVLKRNAQRRGIFLDERSVDHRLVPGNIAAGPGSGEVKQISSRGGRRR